MYYVYVLKWRKRNNEFYIGYTNNLKKRIKEHQKEDDFQSIYYEVYQLEKAVRSREKRLKYCGSTWCTLKKRIAA